VQTVWKLEGAPTTHKIASMVVVSSQGHVAGVGALDLDLRGVLLRRSDQRHWPGQDRLHADAHRADFRRFLRAQDVAPSMPR